MGMLRRARTDLVIEFAGTVYTFLFEKEIDCSKKLFNKKFGSEYINSLKGNIDVLIEEAEKGVLSSQLKLADLLYYNSINYLSDAKEAYSLYQKIAGKKAANKEDQEIIAEACYRLGKFYFVREVNSRSSNIGEVLEDMAKMMGGYRGDPSFYLKKAVRLGHSEAKIALYGAGLYPEFIQEEKARQLEEERLKKEEANIYFNDHIESDYKKWIEYEEFRMEDFKNISRENIDRHKLELEGIKKELDRYKARRKELVDFLEEHEVVKKFRFVQEELLQMAYMQGKLEGLLDKGEGVS